MSAHKIEMLVNLVVKDWNLLHIREMDWFRASWRQCLAVVMGRVERRARRHHRIGVGCSSV